MQLDPNLLLTVGVNLVVAGIAWGALHTRVKALEKEVSALGDLAVRMARLETKIDNFGEQLKDLNASIRWMRDPAPAYEPHAPGVVPPRKGG